MKLMQLAILAGAGIGTVVYYFRRPFPYAFYPEDVWKIRYLCAESWLYSWLARIGSAVGLGSQIGILRRLYRFSSSYPTCISQGGVYFQKYCISGVNVVVYKKLEWVPEEEDQEEVPRPCLIYFHGGGFIFTSPLERDAHNRYFVQQLDAVVVAVDYRKAPEFIFPAAFQDCLAAAKHIYENPEFFGIDNNRITVCGDSAGGSLSAAVALKLRDEGLHFIKNQVLIYPGVQLTNFRTQSWMVDYPMMTTSDGLYCVVTYTGESEDLIPALRDNEHVTEEIFGNPGFLAMQKREVTEAPRRSTLIRSDQLATFREKMRNPYLAPLMARTLRNLPRALLVLCEYDILLDDGLAYADRLEDDGVDVTLVRIPGYHGAFRDFQFTRAGKEMMQSVVKWLETRM